jgi:major type 1 subunit fimbrin (pilin)
MKRIITKLKTLLGAGLSLRHRIAITLLFVSGFGSHAAFAQTAVCSTPGTQTVSFSFPATITAPRDAASGTLLTSWVTTQPTTTYFGCITSGTASAGMVFKPFSLTTKSATTVTDPHGIKLTVWNTAIPGIGIAVGVSSYSAGCGGWQPWQDLALGNVQGGYTGTLCNKAGSWATGGQAEMAFVQTGAITAGSVTGGVIFQGTSATNINGSVSVGTSPLGNSVVYPFSLSSTTKVSVAACTTPDVTVNMGSHQQWEFNGVGSATTPAVSFDIAVNACPSGLAKIQYQFIPVNAVLDATNGVLALSDSSTATGIGVQLKDDGGNALNYKTQYTLSGYNTATGGSYNIPLTAAYYQTASTVTPGSANAVLTFTMTYQ